MTLLVPSFAFPAQLEVCPTEELTVLGVALLVNSF